MHCTAATRLDNGMDKQVFLRQVRGECLDTKHGTGTQEQRAKVCCSVVACERLYLWTIVHVLIEMTVLLVDSSTGT